MARADEKLPWDDVLRAAKENEQEDAAPEEVPQGDGEPPLPPPASPPEDAMMPEVRGERPTFLGVGGPTKRRRADRAARPTEEREIEKTADKMTCESAEGANTATAGVAAPSSLASPESPHTAALPAVARNGSPPGPPRPPETSQAASPPP